MKAHQRAQRVFGPAAAVMVVASLLFILAGSTHALVLRQTATPFILTIEEDEMQASRPGLIHSETALLAALNSTVDVTVGLDAVLSWSVVAGLAPVNRLTATYLMDSKKSAQAMTDHVTGSSGTFKKLVRNLQLSCGSAVYISPSATGNRALPVDSSIHGHPIMEKIACGIIGLHNYDGAGALMCHSSGVCKTIGSSSRRADLESSSESTSFPSSSAFLTISFQFLASVVPTLLPALEDGVKAAFASTQWQSQGATITSEESSLTRGFLITTITLETSQAAVDALYSDFAHTWTNGSWPWNLAKLVPCTATVGIARNQHLSSPGSVNNTLVSCTGGGVGGARAEPALCPSSGLCQSLPIVTPVLESLFFLAVQWNASYASTLLPFLTRATSILAIGTGQQARVLDITSVESPITRGFIFTTVTVQASQAAVDVLYEALVSPWSAGSKAANLITNGGIPCASQMMVRATQGSSFRNTILSCSGGGTQATPGLCSGSGVCGQRAAQ